MFDAKLRPIIDPPLNLIGGMIAKWGVNANQLTIFNVVWAIAAFAAIANQSYVLALLFVIINRVFDGLDGAVARATTTSDFGGYLDIVGDFVFYVAIPLGFGIAAANNQIAALLLISSFTLTGISFLAFAIMAQKRGIETNAHGKKSFFYNTGLAEGAETIFAFVLMCLFPAQFNLIAYVYAIICVITVIQRTLYAQKLFSDS